MRTRDRWSICNRSITKGCWTGAQHHISKTTPSNSFMCTPFLKTLTTVWLIGRSIQMWFFNCKREPQPQVSIGIIPWTNGTTLWNLATSWKVYLSPQLMSYWNLNVFLYLLTKQPRHIRNSQWLECSFEFSKMDDCIGRDGKMHLPVINPFDQTNPNPWWIDSR